jgi:4-diphosphocytidyl-2-C-methyl-D-erythritol kinase
VTDLDVINRRAHAKINLTLAIFGRRPDGYHDIESWMAPISWYDSLSFSKAGDYSLVVSGDTAVPDDGSNLVTKAHAALAAHVAQPLPTRIELEKRIPTGAGLGGGSSDAAATLRGMNELWGLGLSVHELLPLAASVGSDVPFFLFDSNAIVTGRGEHVTPVHGWHGSLVLIVPPFGIATASVYGQYARHPTHHATGRPWENPNRAAKVLQDELFNDLQPAAFEVEPRLAELHRRIDGLEGHRVLMSGSGSTLYAIFSGPGAAIMWADRAERIVGNEARIVQQMVNE